MTQQQEEDLKYLRDLLDILRSNKVKDYQTSELHITFDHAAFYTPPKQPEQITMESLYAEVY